MEENSKTTKELLQKAKRFLKINENISWKPIDSPEKEMSVKDALDILEFEGTVLYSRLCAVNPLLEELIKELETALCKCENK